MSKKFHSFNVGDRVNLITGQDGVVTKVFRPYYYEVKTDYDGMFRVFAEDMKLKGFKKGDRVAVEAVSGRMEGIVVAVFDGYCDIEFSKGRVIRACSQDMEFAKEKPPVLDLFSQMARYIIETTQKETSRFQWTVDYKDVQEKFALEINEYINGVVIDRLLQQEEVADAILDTDGFDVVLHTDYSPNYDASEYEE